MQATSYTVTAERMTARKRRRGRPVFAGRVGLQKRQHMAVGTAAFRQETVIPMIIGEIRRYLRDNNPIRVSRSIRDMAYKALRAREELTYELGHEPTMEEIAHRIEQKAEDVTFALDAIQDPVSLFEPLYQDGGDAIYVMDQVRDDKVNVADWIRDLSIEQAMKSLTEREKGIIEKRFFEGRTQMEVAGEIGISQAQVSRLEKAALKQMKKYV